MGGARGSEARTVFDVGLGRFREQQVQVLNEDDRDLRRVGQHKEELDAWEHASRELIGRHLFGNSQDASDQERRQLQVADLVQHGGQHLRDGSQGRTACG